MSRSLIKKFTRAKTTSPAPLEPPDTKYMDTPSPSKSVSSKSSKHRIKPILPMPKLTLRQKTLILTNNKSTNQKLSNNIPSSPMTSIAASFTSLSINGPPSSPIVSITTASNQLQQTKTVSGETCKISYEIESENATAESLYNNNIAVSERSKCVQESQSYELNINGKTVSQEAALIEECSKMSVEEYARFADEPEYRMNHYKRGTALIINNKQFEKKLEMPARDGTDKDAASLEFALYKLGFDVKTAHNCTASFMRDLLYKLSKMDYSDSDCFLCVIMSHGENGIIYGVDREIELDQLIQPFRYNRSLAGKPKLFFVQACRGSNLMDGIDSNPLEMNYVSKIPMEADFLIAYSTVAGYYSWRNSQNGSWFIQSLCHVLNEHGRSMEIMQLLTRVNRRVAYYFESNTNCPEMTGKKQVPSIVSMLTKELYFKPKRSEFKISYEQV